MSNQQEPGLVTGHVKLAGGAVEAALGNLTGNTAWSTAGEETKQAGINELKEYQNQNPPAGQDGTAGTLEQKIGSAVGCDGMVADATGETTTSGSSTTGPAGTINATDKVTPGTIGGTDQPGFGTGGADPGAGTSDPR